MTDNITIKRIEKPTIKLQIYDCNSDKDLVWEIFKPHHYLTAKLNKSAHCFLAYWNDVPVAFNSILTMPSGTLKNAWREHRLVVLSDYQGLGIGNRLSEWVGELLIQQGKRFFSKTANIKLGEYRSKSDKWKATSKNKKVRKTSEIIKNYNNLVDTSIFSKRLCYSHEYIG